MLSEVPDLLTIHLIESLCPFFRKRDPKIAEKPIPVAPAGKPGMASASPTRLGGNPLDYIHVNRRSRNSGLFLLKGNGVVREGFKDSKRSAQGETASIQRALLKVSPLDAGQITRNPDTVQWTSPETY